MRIAINLDLRNPTAWRQPVGMHYSKTLEFIEHADELGIDIVSVSEHHGWDDDYLPQGLTFLAAAAGRTRSIRLMTGVMLLPLHHPVTVAEEAAIVDAVSDGRLELAMGVGYRPTEYELYGLEFLDRYQLYEEKIHRIRELWANRHVSPCPVQQPIPMRGAFRGPKYARLAGELGLAGDSNLRSPLLRHRICPDPFDSVDVLRVSVEPGRDDAEN